MPEERLILQIWLLWGKELMGRGKEVVDGSGINVTLGISFSSDPRFALH